MSLSRNDRRLRLAVANMELLEARCLLSAAATGAIPTQSLSAVQGPQSLSLTQYFADSSVPAGDTVVNIQTNLPAPDNSIPVYLTNAATPQTVANFLQYISSGEYANMIIHRSVPGFVIQGGGFLNTGTPINVFGSIPGEYMTATAKNATPGTIAMALSNGPDTGTSQWFINLANNSVLDTGDGGPFTAFGQTLYNGLTVADDIANLPIVNDGNENGAFTTIPVLSGTNGATVSSEPSSNLVTLNPVVVPGGLNYSASSTNAGVVSASVVNGMLTLTPGVTSGSASITVTATDLGGGTATNTFTVTSVGVNHLAYFQQPLSVQASATLAPVVVDLDDPNNNVMAGDNSDVTLSLSGGASGAMLGGTTTVAAVNGVATFSDLSIADPGSNYVLTAADTGYASGFSAAFNVTAPSPIVPAFGKVTVPPEVVAGANFKPSSVPVVLTNTGAAIKGGSVTVDLYANLGTTLDGNQFKVTSITKTISLKTGKQKTFDFHIKSLSASLPVGNYSLLAEVVDPTTATNVTATTTTVNVAAPFVQPALSVAAVLPASIALNKSGSVMVIVTNNGNVVGTGIGLSLIPSSDDVNPLGGVVLDTLQNNLLKIQPGKSKKFKLHFKVTSANTAGTYFPYVLVTLGGVSANAVSQTSFTVA